MKQNKHAFREQAESWGDKVAVCGWYGQSYDLSSWWTTEWRQKMPDRGQAKMRAETKPKKTRVDRNEVVRFRWICIYPWCFEVIRCCITWYIAIYRDIILRIPYHAISQDTIYRDIGSMSRFLGTDTGMEISYPVEILLDSQHYLLGTPNCAEGGWGQNRLDGAPPPQWKADRP